MKINKPSEQIIPEIPSSSETAVPVLSERQEKVMLWLPLWLCAVILLLGNLGVQAVYGSEARWMEITREMFFTGDFLHPTINFDPYFDKPLLTYWFAVLCSFFNSRIVTELTARIPSALAALVALGATVSIAKQLWDSRTAVVSGWIFMTFYSFAFWGRLAEADMANLAFSTVAVAWFLAYRDRKSFFGYFVFFLICFIGAHAKGLATIAIPFLVAFADMVINRRILLHLNWKSVLAFVIGAGIYMIPFELSKMIAPAIPVASQSVIDVDGTVKTSGIALALRENVIRYFNPFDHKEPFYAYLIHVPRLTLPWTPILLLAIIQAFFSWKKYGRNEKWLCWSMIAIFLFFTISGSKRHYYILPLIPFCGIFCALFLLDRVPGWIGKTKEIFLKLYRILPLSALLLMFLFCVILVLFPSLIPEKFFLLRRLLPQTMMTLLAGSFILGMFSFWMRGDNAFRKFFPGPELGRSVFSVYVILLIVFLYVFPTANQYRPQKQTLKMMSEILQSEKIPSENIYFYNRPFINAVFYMNRPHKITVLEKPEDLSAVMKTKAGQRVFIISQNRFFDNLPSEMLKNLPRVIKEPEYPWTKRKDAAKNYSMRMLKAEKNQEKTGKTNF